MLVGIKLNGGMGEIVDPGSYAVLGIASLGAGLFAALVLWSAEFRNLVTSEKRRDRYEPRAFVTVLIVGALMGSISLWFALVLPS